MKTGTLEFRVGNVHPVEIKVGDDVHVGHFRVLGVTVHRTRGKPPMTSVFGELVESGEEIIIRVGPGE